MTSEKMVYNALISVVLNYSKSCILAKEILCFQNEILKSDIVFIITMIMNKHLNLN